MENIDDDLIIKRVKFIEHWMFRILIFYIISSFELLIYIIIFVFTYRLIDFYIIRFIIIIILLSIPGIIVFTWIIISHETILYVNKISCQSKDVSELIVIKRFDIFGGIDLKMYVSQILNVNIFVNIMNIKNTCNILSMLIIG